MNRTVLSRVFMQKPKALAYAYRCPGVGVTHHGTEVQAGVAGVLQPQLAQADRTQGGGQLGTQVHGPHIAQAAQRQPIEQDEGRAEHGQLVTAAHGPDEAGPEQQHKGQPAVVGDAPHLDGRGW